MILLIRRSIWLTIMLIYTLLLSVSGFLLIFLVIDAVQWAVTGKWHFDCFDVLCLDFSKFPRKIPQEKV